MAIKPMRKTIAFTPIVEEINRKFALRKETCSQKTVGKKILVPKGYMGSATRTHHVAGYGAVRVPYFFFRKNPLPKTYSTAQTNVRSYFSYASKWVAAMMQDLMVVASNQAKWIAAKNDLTKTIKGVSAAGYESFRSWSFAIAFAVRQDGESLDTHELPNFDA